MAYNTTIELINDDERKLFIPQDKKSAVDVVISNIKRLILTKNLKPGDRLPNETELSKALSVSRGSVREAMKIFSAFGIVEIRQGDGTYISKSAGNALFDPLLFSLILAEPDTEQLSEFRQIMEIEVVNLIIKNADEDDIKKIECVYLEMEKKVNNPKIDSGILAKYDLDFHSAMGSATKNKLVERTYAFIMDFFAPSIEKTHEIQKVGINALHTHKKILDSLMEKNIEKAVKSIEESVIVWRNFLLLTQNDI